MVDPKDFTVSSIEAAQEVCARATELAQLAVNVADMLEGMYFGEVPSELRARSKALCEAIFKAAHPAGGKRC